jgi:hypothetical protein
MSRLEVVWSADPKVEQSVELLGRSGLHVEVSEAGVRAASEAFGSVEELIVALVRDGWRLGKLCVGCDEPADVACSPPVSEGSGLCPQVGEERGARPGRHLRGV